MNKKLLLNAILAVSLLSGMIFSATGTSFAAGSASLSLSPNNGSYANGSTINVGIYENGTNVNVVTADLTYSPSQLQFVSESCTGAFSAQAYQGGSTITCSVPGGSSAVNGSQVVANATFTVIAGSGSFAIGFGSDSQVASAGANVWNGATGGGNYTVAASAPVTSTPAAPVSTPASTSSSSTPSSTPKSTSVSNSAASSNGTVAGTTTTTPSTGSTSISTKSTAKPTKKSTGHNSNNNKHRSWRNAAVTSSGTVLLLAILAGAFYYLILRRPTPAVAPIVYKAGKKTKTTTSPVTHKKTIRKSSDAKITTSTTAVKAAKSTKTSIAKTKAKKA